MLSTGGQERALLARDADTLHHVTQGPHSTDDVAGEFL